MNPYNPGLEQVTSERIRRRMREAEHARLVASARSVEDRDRLFGGAGRVVSGLRIRVSQMIRRPRLA